MDENELISEPLPWRHVWVQKAGGAYRTHEAWLDIGGGGPVMPAQAGTELGHPQGDPPAAELMGQTHFATHRGLLGNIAKSMRALEDDIAGAGREVEDV